MDIEWAKDGITSQMYIVQARPETVHSNKTDAHLLYSYELKEKGNELTSGIALGSKIATGKAKIIQDTKDASQLNEGDILFTGAGQSYDEAKTPTVIEKNNIKTSNFGVS